MFKRILEHRHAILVAIVMAGVIVSIFPQIVSALALSMIGLPIALVLAVTPTAALLLAIVWSARRLIGRSPLVTALALVVPLAISALLAAETNEAIDARARWLTADDFDRLLPVQPSPSVLVVADDRTVGPLNQDEIACDDLCQRLLLSGPVTAVLSPIKATGELNARSLFAEVSWQQGVSCSTEKISSGRNYVRIGTDAPDAPAPDELVKRRMAQGKCLVERDVTLGAADAVLTVRTLADEGDGRRGIDPRSDALRIRRLEYAVRDPDAERNALEPRYRKTALLERRHLPLLLPIVTIGPRFEAALGYLRLERPVNWTPENGLSAANFLSDRLSLPLATTQADPAELHALIDRIIAGGPAGASAMAAIDGWLLRIANAKVSGYASADDLQRVVGLAQAEQYPLSPAYGRAARAVLEKEDERSSVLADALFKRIERDATPAERESAREAAGALLAASGGDVRRHRTALETLAASPAQHVAAAAAFVRLADSGEADPSVLLRVLDASLTMRQADPESGDWVRLRRAALVGLCHAPEAQRAEAARALVTRLAEGRLSAGYEDPLLIDVFVAVGADPELLKPHFIRAHDSWLQRYLRPRGSHGKSQRILEERNFRTAIASARRGPQCRW